MRTEIFLEGNRLDLTNDISAEFTYAIDDVKDFASRNTSFSKTIIISGNATNNKIFGHIFEFGKNTTWNKSMPNVGNNFNAAKGASCVVYIDKVQIFKGVLRLMEIVIDDGIEYECAVFGELGGFVAALGNKYIEELDFSAYNHAWTIANITASWDYGGTGNSGVAGTGYFYPLIDYGGVSANKIDYDFRAYRPALYVREYVDKIITGSGYTYDCPFFATDVFKRLVIPNNQKSLTMSTDRAFNASPTLKTYASSGTTINLEFGNIKQLGTFTANAAKTIFTYTGTTALIGTLNISISGVWATSLQGTLVMKKNGVEIGSSFVGTGSGAGYFTRSIYVSNLSLGINDTLNLDFVIAVVGSYSLSVLDGSFIVTSTTTLVVPVAYGEALNLNNTTPRGIFQKDFFASIVKMFNLYVAESSEKSKHLIIKPYIDFYTSSPSMLKVDDLDSLLLDASTDILVAYYGTDVIDWTYKVDRNKPLRLKPMSELNGRYFEFKYKQDSDYLNEQYAKKYSQGYGDFIEDTGFEFAKDKQTAEIIFSATPLEGYVGADKVVSTIFKLNNNVEESTEHNIRILQVKKIAGVASYAIKNGATTLTTLTSYGYAGHLDDPNFPTADILWGSPKELNYSLNYTYPSANLFNAYWSDYVYEITDFDSKMLTCFVKLDDDDIYTLDFSKLIMIDGNLWRLNKVINYNPLASDTTQCELLKIIDING